MILLWIHFSIVGTGAQKSKQSIPEAVGDNQENKYDQIRVVQCLCLCRYLKLCVSNAEFTDHFPHSIVAMTSLNRRK